MWTAVPANRKKSDRTSYNLELTCVKDQYGTGFGEFSSRVNPRGGWYVDLQDVGGNNYQSTVCLRVLRLKDHRLVWTGRLTVGNTKRSNLQTPQHRNYSR